jgi:hypothetical protein
MIRMEISVNVAIVMFGLFVSGTMALVLLRHRMNQAQGDSLHLISDEADAAHGAPAHPKRPASAESL